MNWRLQRQLETLGAGAAARDKAMATTTAKITALPMSVDAAGVSKNASQAQTGGKIVSVCASKFWPTAGADGAPRRNKAKPGPISTKPEALTRRGNPLTGAVVHAGDRPISPRRASRRAASGAAGFDDTGACEGCRHCESRR